MEKLILRVGNTWKLQVDATCVTQFNTITHQVSCLWNNICKAQIFFKKNIILKQRFQSVIFGWNLGILNHLCDSFIFKLLWFSTKFTKISNFLSTSDLPELWMKVFNRYVCPMAEIPFYIHVLQYFFFSCAVLYGTDLFFPPTVWCRIFEQKKNISSVKHDVTMLLSWPLMWFTGKKYWTEMQMRSLRQNGDSSHGNSCYMVEYEGIAFSFEYVNSLGQGLQHEESYREVQTCFWAHRRFSHVTFSHICSLPKQLG